LPYSKRTSSGFVPAKAWRSSARREKLHGKKPTLSDRQQKRMRRMYDTADYFVRNLAELFSISRPTVYRTLARRPASPARAA
jgi:hypothetical protein